MGIWTSPAVSPLVSVVMVWAPIGCTARAKPTASLFTRKSRRFSGRTSGRRLFRSDVAMALLYRAEAPEAARYHGCLGAPQSQRTRWIALVLINLASLVCLIWALRDVTFGDLKEDLATIDYAWVALAMAFELSVYLSQAVRWRLVLRPVASLSFKRTVRAIFVGLFCSEVLPFRGGEAVRCFLVTRWTKLPFSVSVASVLIERVFDGLWLWLGLWLSLRYVELPRQLGYVNDGLGLSVLGGTVLLGLALFRPRPPRAKLRVPGWRHHLAVLMDDL